MSRGLGKLQLEIKRILQQAWDRDIGTLSFAMIRGVFVMSAGGNPETDKIQLYFERSLKRSLKTLVDRGDVLIIHGKGGPKSPFTYTTVEAFTQEPNTDKAKIALVELMDTVASVQAKLAAVATTETLANDPRAVLERLAGLTAH